MKKILYLLVLVTLTGYAQINEEHLKIGDNAPTILGIDQFGNRINSDIILQHNKILLLFYRGNWCPYCRRHLKELSENLEQLTKKGYQVLVVTPENIEKTKETSTLFEVNYSIIHDTDNKIMNEYLVAFDVNKQNVTNFYKFTLNKIKKYNEPDNAVLPVPATYVINQNGKIAFVHYDPDYKKRASFETILNLSD